MSRIRSALSTLALAGLVPSLANDADAQSRHLRPRKLPDVMHRETRSSLGLAFEVAGGAAWTDSVERGETAQLRIHLFFDPPRYSLGGVGGASTLEIRVEGWRADSAGGGGVGIGYAYWHVGRFAQAKSGLGFLGAVDSVRDDAGVGLMPYATLGVGLRAGTFVASVDGTAVYRSQLGADDRAQLQVCLRFGRLFAAE